MPGEDAVFGDVVNSIGPERRCSVHIRRIWIGLGSDRSRPAVKAWDREANEFTHAVFTRGRAARAARCERAAVPVPSWTSGGDGIPQIVAARIHPLRSVPLICCAK